MDRATLQAYETLARVLIWAAGIVALLSVLGAFALASSSSDLPLIGDIQRESRGITTIGTLIAGFTAAGVLAGVGALLRLAVLDRVDRLEIELVRDPDHR